MRAVVRLQSRAKVVKTKEPPPRKEKRTLVVVEAGAQADAATPRDSRPPSSSLVGGVLHALHAWVRIVAPGAARVVLLGRRSTTRPLHPPVRSGPRSASQELLERGAPVSAGGRHDKGDPTRGRSMLKSCSSRGKARFRKVTFGGELSGSCQQQP